MFTGKLRADGYAKVGHEGRTQMAHRLAYQSEHGEIPKGKLVLHRCDVRHCVRPSHLFLGDAQANMDDMMRKGRGRCLSGSAHPLAKMTPEAVLRVRSDYSRSAKEWAAELKVSPGTIIAVRARQRWASV